jgi:low temperature requirement protein LtrA
MTTSDPTGTGRVGGAWQVPILRDDGDHHRPVGWVELFFDLVFVVIVAVLSDDLAHHSTPDGLLRFVLEFAAVFWVWNAFVYYTERFESGGLENRLFTFVGILSVAGLAVWGTDGLGHNYLGFVAAYLLARVLNIVQWLRAGYHVARFRKAAFGFTGGFVIALALLVVSLFVDETARLALWAIAVAVEIFGPAITSRFQAGLPELSRDKFPERFGLLTLIVLGETVSGVIRGVATANETEHLGVSIVVAAALGLAIGFGMWWVYFDYIARRPTRPRFGIALIWIYLHLCVLISIVVAGVGIGHALSVVDAGALPAAVRSQLFFGLGGMLLIVTTLELMLDRDEDEPTNPVVSPIVTSAAGVALIGFGAFAAGIDSVWAFVVCIAALALPASYGARVYYRRR